MIRKYSATLHGHRTSFSLEEPFFVELKRIAAARAISLAALIAEIDDTRDGGNLSSALRLHVLDAVRMPAPIRAETEAAADRLRVSPAGPD